MRFKIAVTVFSPAEIVSGLDPEADGKVLMARAAAETARRASDDASRTSEQANARVAYLKAAVASGGSTVDDLQAALTAQAAAALVLPGFKTRVDQAATAIADAEKAARANVVREAGKRRDALQVVADELCPILEALRADEEALDTVVLKMGQGDGVKAVTWPLSVEAAAAIRHAHEIVSRIGVTPEKLHPRASR